MAFEITYKPLFQVNILHLFFLNKGEVAFASLSESEKEKQLISHNISNFFTVCATVESVQKLNGYNMVLRPTNTGFDVWTKVIQSDESSPFIDIDDTLELSFLLKQKNHTFINISDLKFESTDKLFLFSNKHLSSEASNFPLIKKVDSATVSDAYVLTDESATNELAKLNVAERQNLFGIVKIHMKGNSSGMNVTTAQQKIRTPNQVFYVVFNNRKTIWRYIFEENQTVKNKDDVKKDNGNARKLITKKKYPLTATGFVSIEHGGVELPNPDTKSVKPNSANNKIYSEIYM